MPSHYLNKTQARPPTLLFRMAVPGRHLGDVGIFRGRSGVLMGLLRANDRGTYRDAGGSCLYVSASHVCMPPPLLSARPVLHRRGCVRSGCYRAVPDRRSNPPIVTPEGRRMLSPHAAPPYPAACHADRAGREFLYCRVFASSQCPCSACRWADHVSQRSLGEGWPPAETFHTSAPHQRRPFWGRFLNNGGTASSGRNEMDPPPVRTGCNEPE